MGCCDEVACGVFLHPFPRRCSFPLSCFPLVICRFSPAPPAAERPHCALQLNSPVQFLLKQNPSLCNSWWPDTQSCQTPAFHIFCFAKSHIIIPIPQHALSRLPYHSHAASITAKRLPQDSSSQECLVQNCLSNFSGAGLEPNYLGLCFCFFAALANDSSFPLVSQ